MNLHIASMDALLHNIDALLYNMDPLLSFIDLQRSTPIHSILFYLDILKTLAKHLVHLRILVAFSSFLLIRAKVQRVKEEISYIIRIS